MTFDDLVTICKQIFYKPAEIVEGKKIAGVRSIASIESQLKYLCRFFGKRLLNEITTESLTEYKSWRLKTRAKELGRPIKVVTVNRDLAAMRKMMRFAFGKGWVLRDIFYNAKIIDTGGEVERKRLLTFAEEIRLLDSCQGEREITYTRKWKGREQTIKAKVSVNNPYLKAIIVLALDSGMRKGEILKLRWSDIDFVKNNIRVIAEHTKTERERLAPLSERAKHELHWIKEITEGASPFPFSDFKRSFATAKRLAKLEDLHFHDLRRTAVTRWIQNGVPLTVAGKLAGHASLETTNRHYINTDEGIVSEVTETMNKFNAQRSEPQTLEGDLLN